jgi:hypothetical protein
LLPLHRVSPGLHAPVHTSFTQANVQAIPTSHVPSVLHVYCIKPSHLVVAGLHIPVQVSVTQRYGHDASICHMPVEPQV